MVVTSLKNVAALRLMGISRATVVKSVVIEAAAVAVLGSTLGAGLGLLAALLVNVHYQGVYRTPLRFAVVTPQVLTFALALDRIMNGLTRPITGRISDRVGREPTMTVMFGIQALTILLLLMTASNPLLFVIFSGLAFFSYGEIFSLFPAMSGDLFGRKYATTNYGLLYTSKGVASLLVPVGGAIRAATGSWVPMFVVAIALNALASVVCGTILPRMARAHCDKAVRAVEGAPAFVPAVAGGSE